MTQQQYLEQFDNLLSQMHLITKAKNSDYASSEDAFKNFNLCESLGIAPTSSGILVRMTDKLQRAANLLNREALVTDEKITDTLIDLAVYSLILIIYIQNNESSGIRNHPVRTDLPVQTPDGEAGANDSQNNHRTTVARTSSQGDRPRYV